MEEDYRQGGAALPVNELKLLSKWLINHMRTSDKTFSLHLKAKGIAQVNDGETFQASQSRSVH